MDNFLRAKGHRWPEAGSGACLGWHIAVYNKNRVRKFDPIYENGQKHNGKMKGAEKGMFARLIQTRLF